MADQQEFPIFVERLKFCFDPSIRSSYEPLWKSLANLSYDLHILIEEMDPNDCEIEESRNRVIKWIGEISVWCERETKERNILQIKDLLAIKEENKKIISGIAYMLTKINKIPSRHVQILREDITKVLENLKDTLSKTISLKDTKKDAICIEIYGRLSESVIDNLSVCTWDCREGEEELPELKKSQTMESNVYCFETTKGGQKRPCCAKQETGQPLDFYVAIKAINQTDDKILQAIVLNNGTWELYETRRQGKYVVFRAEKVDSFFILGTLKERDFEVDPFGSLYVHDTDNRVRLEFPKGCVEKPEIFKVTIFPVRVDEMRKKMEAFPDQFKILSATKAIQVKGPALRKQVTVHLPLENIESSADTENETENGYLFYHIDDDVVTQLKKQRVIRRGDTIVTNVDKFSTIVGVRVHVKNINSISSMDILIIIARMYPCKLLTFVDKISEKQVHIWCEIVKKEDFDALKRRRLEENPKLQKIKNSVSTDIFIPEQQRLRVDIQGNSCIGTATPKTSLLITFIPVADGNHTFPLLFKKEGMGGPPYTTITYRMDSGIKTTLYTVSFDPWIMKANPNPSRNVIYNRRGEERIRGRDERREEIIGRTEERREERIQGMEERIPETEERSEEIIRGTEDTIMGNEDIRRGMDDRRGGGRYSTRRTEEIVEGRETRIRRIQSVRAIQGQFAISETKKLENRRNSISTVNDLKMASSLPLSKKQLNFAKVAIACTDIIKLPLVDLLRANIDPSDLSFLSERNREIFRLTPYELKQCCVPHPDYNNFDFTLLYKLIRHKCIFLKPKQGWGRRPNDDDITLADDIERIRLFRIEQVVHVDSAEISDGEFELISNDIKLVMRRMDSAMQNFKFNTNYEQKMEDILRSVCKIEEITPITKPLKEEIENMQKDIITAIEAKRNKRDVLRKAPWFETLEENELAEVSQYIGDDFPILGVVLGLRSSEIDKIRMNHQFSSNTQIFMMLCLWRNKNPFDATIDKLLYAMQETCLNTDITAVEHVLLKRTSREIDENLEKTRIKIASSSSKHRQTISYKVDKTWKEIIKKPLKDIWLCQIQCLAPEKGIKPEENLDIKKLYDLKGLDPFQNSPEALDKFDVMQLYQLIKCFWLLQKPNKGWGQKPEATDTDLGDDIERLIQFRDEVVAFADCPISDVNSSEKIWNDLEFAIGRIQSFLKQYGYTTHYQHELIEFKGRISKEENSIIITTECEEFLSSEGRAIVNITMLKMNPNIQHYIAGNKDKDQVIKVFLRGDENEEKKATDDFRRAFFSSNGMRIEFVNVDKRFKELEKEEHGQKELETEMDNSGRLQMKEVIDRVKLDFFKLYSNITGIRTGRVLSGGKAYCIVLYCLDKHIVPFGEKPLPNEIEGWPCVHREEFGMFAICPFKCPAANKAFPEPGCSIGIESSTEAGSFGFLVKSKNNNFHDGFLTVAHVAVQGFESLYEDSFFVPGFVPLAVQMTNIVHHSSKNESVRVGSVVEAFFGNYERRGLDFAFVHNDTLRVDEQMELTVISEDAVSINDEVTKTGRTTQRTEGRIIDKSFELKANYYFKEYYFFDCYGIEKIGRGLFSFPGDSGSAVFVKKNGTIKPLGILFGLLGSTTAVCKIDRIIERRNLKIYKSIESSEYFDTCKNS